ncbi:MAG TPA: GNAT family N-acetyltransferase [Gemmataceae bacterium]|nr:GNAT family N-acetyltransferase [Gemmataceae bacterium]
MNSTGTSATATLTFRQMAPRDLLQVWRIEQQTSARRWTVQDFLTVLQSGNTVGQIVEAADQIIGYVIYTVQSVPKEDAVPSDSIHSTFAGPHAYFSEQPLNLVLLHLVVHPEWRRRGVGLALLGRLAKKLRHADDRIQSTIPESNLGAQLLLRAGGYKAVRVLRGYFGEEDGYLMEREPG